MSRRWRIRHKLTLGLALVVGIIALILGGTLKGLFSYRQTMKTIDSKLAELNVARRLEGTAHEISVAVDGQANGTHNARDLQERIRITQDVLAEYRQRLCDTLVHHRDLDKGYEEQPLVLRLQDELNKLGDLAKDKETAGPTFILPNSGEQNPGESRLSAQVKKVREIVSTLQMVIDADLQRRIGKSKEDYRTSMMIVGITSILGMICLVGLSWMAYRWIVDPIRELHQQVGRLAQGDFDSRIEVKSSDEMRDLAHAFNDMTERLHVIYADLARQVNERSRQLVRSERLAGVGFLAAGVAHEINNPLASIAFCGEALERRLEEMLEPLRRHPDFETVRNYLTMIQQEAFRCKEITQKLLEFSRVGEKQRQMTSLVDLVQSVIDMVSHLQCYRGRHVEFEARQQPRLLLNAQEIKSVVLNLVVNALESMGDGGTLNIRLDVLDGTAVLTFADSGCGMTSEVLENLFEPFFTRSRTGKGIGLGLSISHRIVTQHGGEIEAASAGPDQGSTFTVRLPLFAVQSNDGGQLLKAA